jgi:hypothetical protein
MPRAAPPTTNGNPEWLFRAAVLVAVVGAVAVIWWSFGVVYLPRQKQARELITQVERLSTEVDNLERAWPKEMAEKVAKQYPQVDARLFEGRADVETWLTGVKELGSAMALKVSAELGQPTNKIAGARRLSLIPATVSVSVQPGTPTTGPASPYQRLLLLCQHLTDEDKERADLTELTVTGGSNSVSRAVLELTYWTGKEVRR